MKKILDFGSTDPNVILPMERRWAWQLYEMGVNNNWVPSEIPMQDDIEQWKSKDKLSDAERKVVYYNMGFFSTAESLTANNIVLVIYNHVADPACRQYLLRQAFEEAIHTHMFVYCCDSLGFDPNEVYQMYNNIPCIKDKDDFVVNYTKELQQGHVDTTTPEGLRMFLRNLVCFYIVMEGIYFYAGIAMSLCMRRQGKMNGIGQQMEYLLRDEVLHLAFGNQLIVSIINEYPECWDRQMADEVIEIVRQGAELEKRYAEEICPEGILGMNPNIFSMYVEYVADRRLERLGLPKIYKSENPFPWLSEAMDLPKEKNFFEERVIEYKTAGLKWNGEDQE